jgi:hypothetical protein
MKTVGKSKPTAKFYDVKGVTGSDGDGVVHLGLVEADLLVDGMLVEVVEEGEVVLVGTGESNSNSLANQLGIHIILAKQEKLASNSLANQLGKNRNLAKLISPRAYMRARIVVAIVVSL